MTEKDCWPHCSECFSVVSARNPLFLATCCHVFCSKCAQKPAFTCPYDQNPTDFHSFQPLSVDFAEEKVGNLYERININGVPCRHSPCSLGFLCKYDHPVALTGSSYRFCPLCILRIDKETAICPFCLADKSYFPASHDPRLQDYLVIGEEEEGNQAETIQLRMEAWRKLQQSFQVIYQWLQTQWRQLRSPADGSEVAFAR